MHRPIPVEARDQDGRAVEADLLTAEDMTPPVWPAFTVQEGGRRQGKAEQWARLRELMEAGGIQVVTAHALQEDFYAYRRR